MKKLSSNRVATDAEAISTSPDKRFFAPPEDRAARRKRETRTKLLDAALELMASKGREAVLISEIAETADVAFGSFYNHFESKEAIYDALAHRVFDETVIWLQDQLAGISDPAAMVSMAMRLAIIKATRFPHWGLLITQEYLQRWGEMLSLDTGSDVLSVSGDTLLKAINEGKSSGRFKLEDPALALMAIRGTLVTVVGAVTSNSRRATKPSETVMKAPQDLAERAAMMMLCLLGLTPKEAKSIAFQPIADLDFKIAASDSR